MLTSFEEEIQQTITYIKNGQLSEAEALCLKLKEVNSQDSRALQLLANIYIRTQKIPQAILTFEQVIQILKEPNRIAKCYNEIALLYQNINQTEKAIEYFKKSIETDQTNAITYYHLGNIYAAAKNVTLAIQLFKQSIALDPKFGQCYNNLAQALATSIANIEEAIIYQYKAIELLPEQLVLKANLALMLLQKGDFLEGYNQLRAYLKDNPEDYKFQARLLDLLHYLGYEVELISVARYIIDDNPLPEYLKRAYFNLALKAFINQDNQRCSDILAQSQYLYQEVDNVGGKMKWAKVFHNYLKNLIDFRNHNPSYYQIETDKEIYILGESHCLSLAHIIIPYNESHYKTTPKFVSGCKIWHLIVPYPNQYKAGFHMQIINLPKGSIVIICVGEIDCRIDEGIMSYIRKHPEIDVEAYLETMLKQFMEIIVSCAKQQDLEIIIQGVPAPYCDLTLYPKAEQEIFLDMIKQYNRILANICQINNIQFLDVYTLTVNSQGMSNGLYHIDTNHLKPNYILKLLP